MITKNMAFDELIKGSGKLQTLATLVETDALERLEFSESARIGLGQLLRDVISDMGPALEVLSGQANDESMENLENEAREKMPTEPEIPDTITIA